MTLEHWRVDRDGDGLAWLTFDRADATTNTLSQAVLAEFNGVLDALHVDPPKGLVIRSGKANGFIAGADVDELGNIHDAQVARALVQHTATHEIVEPPSCVGGDEPRDRSQ